MKNNVWASGLQVTATWYVATETESALRSGNYVKGAVFLFVRKRNGGNKTARDDLAWEIQGEVFLKTIIPSHKATKKHPKRKLA
jgi:putative DNA methylase